MKIYFPSTFKTTRDFTEEKKNRGNDLSIWRVKECKIDDYLNHKGKEEIKLLTVDQTLTTTTT